MYRVKKRILRQNDPTCFPWSSATPGDRINKNPKDSEHCSGKWAKLLAQDASPGWAVPSFCSSATIPPGQEHRRNANYNTFFGQPGNRYSLPESSTHRQCSSALSSHDNQACHESVLCGCSCVQCGVFPKLFLKYLICVSNRLQDR